MKILPIIFCLLLSLTSLAMGSVEEFIKIFQAGNVNAFNYKEMIGYKFQSPKYSTVQGGSLKVWQKIAAAVEKSPVKAHVFKLFNELTRTTSDDGYDLKDSIILLNVFLRNPDVIPLAIRSTAEALQREFHFKTHYIYAFALLDSEEETHRELGMKFVEHIIAQKNQSWWLIQFVKFLTFVRDQKNVLPVMEKIFAILPEEAKQNQYFSVQLAAAFFGIPDYQQRAFDFIEEIRKSPPAAGFGPAHAHMDTQIAMILLQEEATRNYAITILENYVLPDRTLPVHEKINFLHQVSKDKANASRLLDIIWETEKENENNYHHLLELIHEEKLRDVLARKFVNYLKELVNTKDLGVPSNRRVERILQAFTNNFYTINNYIQEIVKAILNAKGNVDFINFYDVAQLLNRWPDKVKEILDQASQSEDTNPQVFSKLLGLTYNSDELFSQYYRSDKTTTAIRDYMVVEIANQNKGPMLSIPQEEMASKLLELFDREKDIQSKLRISEILLRVGQATNAADVVTKLAALAEMGSVVNVNVLARIIQICLQNNNFEWHRELKPIIGVAINYLMNAKQNPHNRQRILNELKIREVPNRYAPLFNLFDQLLNFEIRLRNNVFGEGQRSGDIFVAHTDAAKEKLKAVLVRLINDFKSYQFIGQPYVRNDVISKVRELIFNDELMTKGLAQLGSNVQQQLVSAAKDSLFSVIDMDYFWQSQNNEVTSITLDGQQPTNGQIFALAIYYIERQKNNERYTWLVASLVQALANKEAMRGCMEGAISGFINSIFADEFQLQEQARRSFEAFNEVITLTHIPKLKTIMVDFLANFRSGNNAFDINDDRLNKIFPEMRNNELMKELFDILNTAHLDKIFGSELEETHEIFVKNETPGENLCIKEEKFIKDVHFLVIMPAILSFLSKNYSDMIVFDPQYLGQEKLSFPLIYKQVRYMEYNPNLKAPSSE